MSKLSSAQTVRYYARLGAEAKVRELKTQLAEILAVFPEIAATESLSRGVVASRSSARQRRKRRPMSAAARKAIVDAQRKRWAKQKLAANKT